MKISSILLTLIAFFPMIQSLFCSSTCVASQSSNDSICTGVDQSSCILCANKIYKLVAEPSASPPCQLLPQMQIVANELLTESMDLTGYVSSSLVPQLCTNYTFSGRYGATDYLSKNFTDFPVNHYGLVVRFQVAYVGGWAESDILAVQFQNSLEILTFKFPYRAFEEEESICSTGTADYIRAKEYVIQHNSSNLHLLFRADSVSLNSTQFWGIQNIIIAAQLCHPFCFTCLGGFQNQCLTCASGYYLQGNICLQNCPAGYLYLDDLKQCVSQCPSRYFSDASRCLRCTPGCIVCTSVDQCQIDENSMTPQSLWEKYLYLWVILIVISTFVLAFALYKLIKGKMQPKSTSEAEEKLNPDPAHSESKIDVRRDQNSENQSVLIYPAELIHDSNGKPFEISLPPEVCFDSIHEIEATTVPVRHRKCKFMAEEAAIRQGEQL